MKLSDLLKFRNELDQLSVKNLQQKADHGLRIINHMVDSHTDLTKISVGNLAECKKTIDNAFDAMDLEYSAVRDQVNQLISEAEKPWFQESYKLFEEAEDCETNEQILHNRKFFVNEAKLEADEVLRSRIAKYTDWRFPGIIIRPGTEDFIEDLVGFDPLYVIDRNYDLLKPGLDRFPKLYRNRLCQYTVNEWADKLLLGKIPNEQFGMCLAYNVFNYRPLEVIRQYFEEIYQKLRPGGVFILTYNDCERVNAVELVERFYASYTPGYLIKNLAESIGYEISYTWDDGGPSVFLELKKPGELKTLRGGQTLARIQRLTDYLGDIDFLKRKVYTKEEIADLYKQANDLELDKAFVSQAHPFEIQNLINEKHKEHNEKIRIEAEERFEKELHERAKRLNIDIYRPDLEYHVCEAELEESARVHHGIDTNLLHWKSLLNEKLRKDAEEVKRKFEEEQRLAAEAEASRIAELHQRARDNGINPLTCRDEAEINTLIAEAIDRKKKVELTHLRQRAMELGAGDPNLIRYGYSAEKLKQLIKAKEEGQ